MTEEEIQLEAKKWGHIPKEAHKGDPAKWQDPREFLERSIRETPSLIKQNRKQSKIIETQNKIIETLKQNIERERVLLQPKMKEAFENADFLEYKKLEEQDAVLLERKKEFDNHIVEEKEEDPNLKYAAEANKWLQNNPDYYTNLKIKEVADKAFEDYKKEYPNGTPQQIIHAVDLEVKNIKNNVSFKGTQSAPSTMEKVTREKSYNNLTESAKRVCDNFASYGIKKEDYVKSAEDSCFTWYNK